MRAYYEAILLCVLLVPAGIALFIWAPSLVALVPWEVDVDSATVALRLFAAGIGLFGLGMTVVGVLDRGR